MFDDVIINIREFEEKYGWSQKQQESLRTTKKLPYYRMGDKVFYNRRTVQKWIMQCGESNNKLEEIK